MNKNLLGTAMIAAAASAFTSGCGILETFDVPKVRFDSRTYVVQPGDTLDSVASRYKIDPGSLSSINSLELSELVPGQRLLLLREEEVASVAAFSEQANANRRRNTGTDTGGSGVAISTVDASAVGQPVVLPGAARTVTASETAVINTDVLQPGQRREQIIGVVDVSQGDALLDDQPLFVSDEEFNALRPVSTQSRAAQTGPVGINRPVQTERPQGVETIVQTVNVGGNSPLPARVIVPAAATVEIADADNSSARRITVNQRDKGWNWPVLGTITQDFDLKEINRQGLDIDPGPGAAVQAAADGEVVYSGRDLASYGNLVILRHENNFLSAYSKVEDIFVKENQKVKAGDLIAAVGENEAGNSEVHFEIRRNGEPVNPIDYLPAL